MPAVPASARDIIRLAALMLFASAGSLAAQTGGVAGEVRDSATGDGIPGVRVEMYRETTIAARGVTDAAGRFSFTGIPPGDYSLVFSRIGYHQRTISGVTVAEGETVLLARIRLVPQALVLNPVIVTASRAEQKVLEAPASVSVIERAAIERRPALTPIDHVQATTGTDVATTGITQHEVVARGFNNVSSGALLTLTDYRYAHIPSLRINLFNFIPSNSEDIERIEMVRGPGAALYGPNSANGVLHLFTKSPLRSPGTVLSLAGGERAVAQVALRHARAFGDVGVKLSAQYMRGRDWPHTDPVEVANRASALAGGADADTLLIGRRDTLVERVAAEARLDWEPSRTTSVVVSAGLNHASRNVDITPVGAAQVRGWDYMFAQARVSHHSLFAQAFINASDAGNTYLLRTGLPVVDRSRMLAVQLQHGTTLGARHRLTYGVDLQRTIPRTGGTITGRNENDDTIDEAGVYLHAESELTPALDVVAAARLDHHNRLSDPVLSPRAALVLRPSGIHNLRLAYNRAFSTPTTNNLFLDLFADSLRAPTGIALPYAIRVTGVPSTGFTFKQTCGGPCMRSPFTPPALGGPGAWLPVEGTALWQAVVDSLLRLGVDFSGIPAPTPSDVATRLFLVDGLTGQRSPLDSLADIPPLRPAIWNTLELGYKGALSERVLIAVDLYRTRVTDFTGPLKIETPTAHFDSTTLANYLAQFVPPDSAATLAALAQLLPLGTVSPEEATEPWDLLITYRNFGDLTLYGADLEIAAILTPALTLRGNYSWVSDDFFIDAVTGDSVALNAPANKGSLAARYAAPDARIMAELRGRFVAGFPMNSGVYVDSVQSYTTVDAMLGYTLGAEPLTTVTVSAQNLIGWQSGRPFALFDHRHREFVGAPALGRMVLARVRVSF
ncbi:MAG: TonB-dependent receptor domain-containing protein [Gemmatimonadales bacterium]